MKFRKKPVVIEAMQFTDEMKDRVFNWVTCPRYASFDCNQDISKDKPTLIIQAPEGNMGSMKVQIGDWVIKDKGEFYRCKPDIFEATYEPVDDVQ